MLRKRTCQESNYHAVFIDGKTIRIAIDKDEPVLPLTYPEFFDIKLTNKCSGGCQFCFLPGTLISTIDGVAPIESIEVGEVVLGYNVESQEIVEQSVDQIFERDFEGECITIETDDGKILKMTPNHKVFTSNRGWVEAGDLTIIDEIVSM